MVDNIVQRGLLHDFIRGLDTFDIVSNNLILAPKVPRYSYSILSNKITPKKSFECWEDLLDDPSVRENLEWEEIHTRNFKCTVETQLRYFLFFIFTKQLPLNNFFVK